MTQREALLEKLREQAARSNTTAPSDPSMEKVVREPGEAVSETPSAEVVQGYKMEAMNQKDDTTEVASSGIQWAASLFVLLILAAIRHAAAPAHGGPAHALRHPTAPQRCPPGYPDPEPVLGSAGPALLPSEWKAWLCADLFIGSIWNWQYD